MLLNIYCMYLHYLEFYFILFNYSNHFIVQNKIIFSLFILLID